MDATSASSSVGSVVGVFVQKQMLDAMRVQGAAITRLIDATPTPAASVNSPSQGRFIDAFA